MLAPATDVQDALAIARGVCKALEQLALPHALSPLGVVTISIGVAAVLPDDSSRPEQLIGSADRALYRAKQGGRNQAQCSP
jgi:diguanylate cyclase (GGDEF)-like protein